MVSTKRCAMKSGKIGPIAFLFVLFSLFPLTAQNLLEKGEEAFLNNQAREAITYLSTALEGKVGLKKHYLYLGIAYQQVGEYDQAVKTLAQGINKTPPPHANFYFNMGNSHFSDGQAEKAESAYSQAISRDETFNPPYLNRANARMHLERYQEAVQDYRLYLLREPEAPQREVIEELIRRVENYQAEETKRKEEEKERRRAEEEHRKALLQSVLSSLKDVEDDTVNLKADSEDIEEFNMELDIED